MTKDKSQKTLLNTVKSNRERILEFVKNEGI